MSLYRLSNKTRVYGVYYIILYTRNLMEYPEVTSINIARRGCNLFSVCVPTFVIYSQAYYILYVFIIFFNTKRFGCILLHFRYIEY